MEKARREHLRDSLFVQRLGVALFFTGTVLSVLGGVLM
jgi:hypothetical protein